MATAHKSGGKAASLPMGIGIGAGCALLWTLIASGILGKMLDTQKLPESAIGYGAMIILLTASFLGSEIACGRIKRQRVTAAMLTGLVYYLSLFAMTAMFFGGQYTGIGVTGLVILAGCGATILLGLRQGKKQKGRSYPKRHK